MHPKSRKTSQKVSSCLLPTTVAIPEAARPPAVFQAEGARVATSSWQKSSKKSVTTSLKRFARIILRPLAIRVKASTELTDPNGRATASKKYTWESAGFKTAKTDAQESAGCLANFPRGCSVYLLPRRAPHSLQKTIQEGQEKFIPSP